jgi:regulatory protein
MQTRIQLSPSLAVQKIRAWCAYQERSQMEARSKLYEYGLNSTQVEEIISTLIGDNYLNEERFALALAGGKFRIKQWGRFKIKRDLQKHKVTDYLISKALKSIPEEEYREAIVKLIRKKKLQSKNANERKVYFSILNYLVSRGFESSLAAEELKKQIAFTDEF